MTREVGRLLAEGRDAQIFEYGPGLVLRRAKDGRSLEAEAAVMRYASDAGYPCPRVHDLVDGAIVVDRIDGPTLIDTVVRRPRTMAAAARTLADLHRRLHELDAPPGVPAGPGTGTKLLHLDLHPLNVLVTDDGPTVIDWSNAASGDPAADVAMAWLIMATSEIPGRPIERLVGGAGRGLFLRFFTRAIDRDAAADALPAVAALRGRDPNVTAAERARVERFVGRTLGT